MRLFRDYPPIRTLTEGFRVFTKPRARQGGLLEELALPAPTIANNPSDTPLRIHIDTAASKSGDADAKAAFGIFFSTGDPRNTGSKVPEGLDQTMPSAVILATIWVLCNTPINSPLHVISTRGTMLKILEKFHTWEDQGWFGVANGDILLFLMSELRIRTAHTIFSVAKTTPDKAMCMTAHDLADASLSLPGNVAFNTAPRPETVLRGMKLSSLTQATAYKAIKSLRGAVERKATNEHIKMVQTAVAQLYERSPTAGRVWKSIKHKDITRQIRSFLWRCMHGSLRIGKYWRHIPGFEEREMCPTCQVPDDLEHILLHCTRPGQAIIWDLVKEVWTKKGHVWQAPTLGAILGCGLASFTVHRHSKSIRLYKIIMTESTHLIWKLRCEFVVGRDSTDPASDHEVRNRWVFQINERIEVDRNLTNTLKYGKQYSIAPSVVLETWRGVLKDEDLLPDNWLGGPEVLVGIAPDRSRRPPSPPVGRRGRNR
ncbi:hypothetical protein K438DRAFT_1601803 [Mycena galopus ATCC 62051]|nr:hypothetical protein K438DRAFT_1601803 [Mycena galopus ATCC 62051]